MRQPKYAGPADHPREPARPAESYQHDRHRSKPRAGRVCHSCGQVPRENHIYADCLNPQKAAFRGYFLGRLDIVAFGSPGAISTLKIGIESLKPSTTWPISPTSAFPDRTCNRIVTFRKRCDADKW